MILGKKGAVNPLKPETEKLPADSVTDGVVVNNEKTATSNEENSGGSTTGSKDGWSHGVTESEWEMAQRATRTATWGEGKKPLQESEIF
jgi:hypothetical protein